MDKAKIAFLAVATVAVLAAAGLGVVAKMKYDGAAAACSERDGKVSSLDRIYRGDVFPNAENVKAMDGVLGEYAETLTAFTNALGKSNIALTANGEMSPSAFQSKLSDVVRTLQAKAPLVDGRKSVPSGFAFGFEAYFGKDTMPAPEEVPLLVQQLTITTMLTLEAYGAEVLQITKIERDAHDKATIELNQGGDRRGAAQPEEEEEQPRRRGKKRRAEEERAPLFKSQPMALEFTARQDALIDFLNRLTSIGRPFVVVKSAAVKKTGDDLRKAPAPDAQEGPKGETRETRGDRGRGVREGRGAREGRGRDRRGARGDFADSAPAPAAPAAPKPSEMPPELRVVSGPDVDPPLSVRLELEIMNFGVEAE